jgi:hypothetical protein
MVTVKVLQLNIWKNGKGYFFKALGKDHFAYGVPSFKVGSIIDFEEGTDLINKAKEAKRVKVQDRVEAFIDENKARSATIENTMGKSQIALQLARELTPSKDSRENYWANKEAADRAKEPVITMLSCISSACVLFQGAGRTEPGEIVSYAEAFFAAAMRKKGASP